MAYDQGRRGARIYAEGSYAIHPDWEKNPQARIHSDLFALPGNSGGAVLNKTGELVGILASGDGNVNEIIPASLIKKLEIVRAKSTEMFLNEAEQSGAVQTYFTSPPQSTKIPHPRLQRR